MVVTRMGMIPELGPIVNVWLFAIIGRGTAHLANPNLIRQGSFTLADKFFSPTKTSLKALIHLLAVDKKLLMLGKIDL